MPEPASRFRFLLIQPYSQPPNSAYQVQPASGSAKPVPMNYDAIAHLLADVDWDLHPGPLAPHGEGGVEMREEFARAGVARLPIVREACASGRYNAVVLLGGGDPGFIEAREIGYRYGVAVTACAHAQMHVAGMLGNKFAMIDVSETHNMSMYDLVVRYRFTDRCASIRNINFPLPRPGFTEDRPVREEAAKLARGEGSPMLEAAVAESVAAIEEDGAEVIIFGCSAVFWMRPHLERRLHELGWPVPVLEGYGSAIEHAKLLVGLGVNASGLAFPIDRPRAWRRKKVF